MENKPLIETNPYLKDPAKRQAMFSITVSSLTAIEGVHAAVTKAIKAVKKSAKPIVIAESSGK